MLFPIVVNYPEEKFGGFQATTDYRDPFVADEIKAHGWMIWPPIRFSNSTHHPRSADAAAVAADLAADRRRNAAPRSSKQKAPDAETVARPAASSNRCGSAPTTRTAHDIVARLIYGFRISVLFGLMLAGVSSVIGIAAGAVQGYFGGWTRPAVAALHRDLVVAARPLHADHPVGDPRAELLRAARDPAAVLLGQPGRTSCAPNSCARATSNMCNAARALGLSNAKIMVKHVLPNAMVATLTFLPFIVNSSIRR